MAMGKSKSIPLNSGGMVFVGATLADELDKMSRERGLSIGEFIDTAMKNLQPRITKLNLDTEIPFGKYHGAAAHKIIRADPDYMRWVHKNVDKVCFSEEAIELLDEIEKTIYK